MEGGIGHAEPLGVLDGGLLVADQVAQLADDGPAPPHRRDGLGRDRLDQAHRLEHVLEQDVPRLEDERGRTGRHALVGLVDDDTAPHATDDADQTFGFEDPQGFPQ